MKIKLLHITGSLHVGGVETVAMNILRSLDREKFQMDFLVFDEGVGEYEEEAILLGAKIHRLPNPTKGYYPYYKGLLKVLKGYDMVHSHTLFNSGINILAAKKAGVKYRIAHAHDNLSYVPISKLRVLYQKLMRHLIIKNANGFLACSKVAGEYLLGSKVDVKVILNTIDVDRFLYSDEIRDMKRAELGIAKTDVVIGSVGRLEVQKNHLRLLEVCKELLVASSNNKVLIVGEGSERTKLETYIADNNLHQQVLLSGTRGDVDQLLNVMDVFVLPSIHEGLGIVLVEAQSNGLVCIAETGVVPDEAKILDSFVFLPNGASNDLWQEALRNNLHAVRTENAASEVKDHKYDLSMLKEEIESYYFSVVTKVGL